ncbi:hypothetical protein FACS1894187_05920 [Synergistales bacterium]|nr:hypothetical protein FACS1894187_05920 [Synergistales bacterium]
MDYHCVVSTQTLNELCNVCIKKSRFSFEKIQNILERILVICDLFVVDKDTIYNALKVHSLR